MIGKIKYSHKNLILSSILMVLCILYFYVIHQYGEFMGDIKDYHQNNKVMFYISDEIKIFTMDAREDLKNYISTGDTFYKDQFLEKIEIRDGLHKRPFNALIEANNTIGMGEIINKYFKEADDIYIVKLDDILEASNEMISFEQEIIEVFERGDKQKAMDLLCSNRAFEYVENLIQENKIFSNEIFLMYIKSIDNIENNIEVVYFISTILFILIISISVYNFILAFRFADNEVEKEILNPFKTEKEICQSLEDQK